MTLYAAVLAIPWLAEEWEGFVMAPLDGICRGIVG